MGLESRVVGCFRSLLLVLCGVAAGCQANLPGMDTRLAAHVASIDFSGLSPDFSMPELKVRAAIPQGWQAMAEVDSPLYTHQQWRSLTHSTGVGVAYIHLPLPMSAKALVWLAKTQYSQQAASERGSTGKMLGEWSDSLGREWFEGENSKYHVKGYVVTNGFDAWAVYSGYRLRSVPSDSEISLAFRSMDSIVPQVGSGK